MPSVRAIRRTTVQLMDSALAELAPFPVLAEPLREMARFVVARACPEMLMSDGVPKGEARSLARTSTRRRLKSK